MSDLKVTAATETARVSPAGADAERRSRRDASRDDQRRRELADEAGGRPLTQADGNLLRVQWEIADDGELRIRLVDADGRTVGEVTPEELLARAGGGVLATGLLVQTEK